MMRVSRPAVRGNTALAHAYDFEQEPEPELIENIIPLGQRRTILELTEDTCRWPIGDPGSTEFFFCGGKPAPARPIAPTTRASPISRRATAAATAAPFRQLTPPAGPAGDASPPPRTCVRDASRWRARTCTL